MKKVPLLTLAWLLAALPAFSQNVKTSISGTVVEEENSQPVIQAGVQLLSKKDSSMVAGVLTDNDGRFQISLSPGEYILKISYIGSTTHYSDVRLPLSRSTQDLGIIPLTTDSVFLESAMVTAKAPPVTVIEDTVVYNAAAYRVAEDATLGELLKKIPGLEVSGGTVTLHGKEVKELLVGGKRFFGGDVKTGLKNLTADMVENIRAYERESDMARLTGVDDGEEVPVLDVTVKKNVLGTWKNLVAAGYGTSDKYLGKASATKISKKKQISVIANTQNASDDKESNVTARNVLGNGSEGVKRDAEAGVTYSVETKKYELGASLQYTGFDRTALNSSRSESILASSRNFSNGIADYHNLKNDLRANVDFEWSLPEHLTVILASSLSYSGTNNFTNSLSSQFKKDPYGIEGYDPAEWLGIEFDDDPFKSIRVNSTNNLSQTISNRLTEKVTAQVSKRLSAMGRSASARIDFIHTDSDEAQGHDYLTRYYMIKKNPDSTRVRKQYVRTGSPNNSLMAQLVYSEPLKKHIFLQAIYTFNYRWITNDKNFYSLQNGAADWSLLRSDSMKEFESRLPDGYASTYDPLFSSEGHYDYFSHRINLNLRYITKKMNITGGLNIVPQSTVLSYDDGDGIWHSTRSSVTDISPLVTIKLKRKKNTQFDLTYRGAGRPQSMYSLMPVTNGTNATSVFQGNPELKPSFQHTVNIKYTRSNLKKQSSFISNIQYVNILHSASNCTEYDPDSGIRTTTPRNIEGNWFVKGNISANKSLRDSRFSISSHTRGEYRNNMSYLYNSKLKVAEVNQATRTLINEQAEFSFRNDWFELLVNAGGEYTFETSRLRPDMNQSPWSVTAGMATDVTLPWKMHFTADFSTIFNRGNVYDELNCDFYVLNARLTQVILKGKGLLRLDWYDMLGSERNIVRSFSSERRTIAFYNGTTSYLVLRFVYKFKVKS